MDLLSLANAKYIISTIPLVDENLTLLECATPRDRRALNELSAIEKGIRLVKENFNWKCKVDGEETEIFPAYHAFWGVSLEENGTEEAVFEYCPPYRIFE